MIGRVRVLALLVVVSCAVTAESGNILVKQDPNGKRIYYNIPTHTNGDPQGIYYSEHVQDYQAKIEEISSKYGVDPDLVKAVIQVESNYDNRAVSRKGAKGLMQLMPDTATRYGVRSIFDPSQNIEGGVRYLKDLIALFNSDLRLTLAAYNAGENCVQKINDVPDYVETQNYVRKVLALYNGEVSYTPYTGGGRVGTVTYWKFVDEKGVTHYSADPVNVANATKVSFSYAW